VAILSHDMRTTADGNPGRLSTLSTLTANRYTFVVPTPPKGAPFALVQADCLRVAPSSLATNGGLPRRCGPQGAKTPDGGVPAPVRSLRQNGRR
jgi:hypothetical protein